MTNRFSIVATGVFVAASLQALAREPRLAVANKIDGTVSIINVSTSETRVSKVGYLPHEVALGKEYAYVSNYGSAHIRSSDTRNKPGNTISVVQLDAPYTVQEIKMGSSLCAPHGLALSKDEQWLYATCEGRNEIAVVDIKAHRLSHLISTAQAGSHLIVLSPDGSMAYVSNFWHGTVSVIDLKQRKLLAQIPTGRGSEGIGLSQDGEFIYVTRVEDDEIVKVDAKTFQVVLRKTLSKKTSPIRVWPAPHRSDQILVNSVGTGKLLVFDSKNLELVQEIPVGRQPIGLAASDTHYAFVANMKDNNIVKINLISGSIENTYPTGSSPDGISFYP